MMHGRWRMLRDQHTRVRWNVYQHHEALRSVDAVGIRTPQAQQLESQRRRSRLSSLILWYACAIFVAFFAFAAWVSPSRYGR